MPILTIRAIFHPMVDRGIESGIPSEFRSAASVRHRQRLFREDIATGRGHPISIV